MEESEAINALELFKSELESYSEKVSLQSLLKLPMVASLVGPELARTRLLPYLKEHISKIYCHEEAHLYIAQKLAGLLPLFGGKSHAIDILEIYKRFACMDEASIRGTAIEALRHLAEELDDETVEEYFAKFVLDLLDSHEFAARIAAAELITICYPRVSEDTKTELKSQYMLLYEDDSPMVRNASAANLGKFLKVLEQDYAETNVLNLFKKNSEDDQDAIRVHSVDLIAPMAQLLDEKQIREHVLEIWDTLSRDTSWKVRLQMAYKLPEIQTDIGASFLIDHGLPNIDRLVNDDQNLVREAIASKIIDFTEVAHKQTDSLKFSLVFQSILLPMIQRLSEDACEAVKLTLATSLMRLAPILQSDGCKKFLKPLIITSLETFPGKVESCLITNLNQLILTIGVDNLDKEIEKVMFNLLAAPATNWRTRRNLITTTKILSNCTEKEYFAKYVTPFYYKLVTDHVFGVRRTATLVLPEIIKTYGFAWAKSNVLNKIFTLVDHPNYLLRLTVLFCIDEMVEPTIQKRCDKILDNLKTESVRLFKIDYYTEFLNVILHEYWIEQALVIDVDFKNDLVVYAEETLDVLVGGGCEILNVNVVNGEIYVESLLVLIIKYVVDILKRAFEDKVENVRLRSVHSIRKIVAFTNRLKDELAGFKTLLKDVENTEEILVEIYEELADMESCMNEDFKLVDKGVAFKKKVFTSMETLAGDHKPLEECKNEAFVIDDIGGDSLDNGDSVDGNPFLAIGDEDVIHL